MKRIEEMAQRIKGLMDKAASYGCDRGEVAEAAMFAVESWKEESK